jgi:Pyridoxamine 5'-phosphate oxidase
VRWDAFTRACPEIAGPAEERFRADQLVMLGTLRKDGSPRISPCELDFAAGHLLLGMMWRSRKALDLLRDPRIVVHSIQSDREASVPDLKLYGRADEIAEPELRRSFHDAILARIEWAPAEPNYHLFALDVLEAVYFSFPEKTVLNWRDGAGLTQPAFPEVE